MLGKVAALVHDHAAGDGGDPGRHLPVDRAHHDQRVDALVVEELQGALERVEALAAADDEHIVAALMRSHVDTAADRREEGMLDQARGPSAHRQPDGEGAPRGRRARVVVAAVAELGGGLAHALGTRSADRWALPMRPLRRHACGGAAHAGEGGDILQGRRSGLGCHRWGLRGDGIVGTAIRGSMPPCAAARSVARASPEACSRS